MNRRSILRLIGASPVAAPALAKAALEQEAMSLAGICTPVPGYGGTPPSCSSSSDASKDQIAKAMRIPAARREIEALVWEEERMVCRLDPDIALHRSFSLSAKIVYQRRRNVERRLAEMERTSWNWQRMNEIILKAVGFLRS